MTIEEFMLIRYDVDVRLEEEADAALARMTTEFTDRIRQRREGRSDRDALVLLDHEMARAGFPVVRNPSCSVVITQGAEPDQWSGASDTGVEPCQARPIEGDGPLLVVIEGGER